jgi:Ca2+-binding RTX toxin-like protein
VATLQVFDVTGGLTSVTEANLGVLAFVTPTASGSTGFTGDLRNFGLATVVFTITGSGLTYSGAGIPTGGTITGFGETRAGQALYAYSALDLPAATFRAWVLANDSDAPRATLLAGGALLLGGDGADTIAGLAGNDTLDGGAGSDLLQGNAGADSVSGGTGADTLAGADGDDTLLGGAGADILEGGTGFDAVSYATSAAAVAVNLGSASGTGGDAEGDVLSGIQVIIGSSFADLLFGDADHNILEGGGGGDTIAGNAGNDWVSYAGAASRVAVTLAVTSGNGWLGDATGDGIQAIENIRGSAFADALYGDLGANILAGGAGADTLYGDANSDAAYYAASSAAVQVDLSANRGTGGHAGGDVLVSMENVFGSAFADTLIGDSTSNTLVGWRGQDVMAGNGGNDIFRWSDIGESGTTTATRDIVTDFLAVHGDAIDLAGIDADTAQAGRQSFTFIGTAAFSGAGQVRYTSDGAGNTILSLNVDATPGAEMDIAILGTIAFTDQDLIL